jgi:hypothetical protein
MKNLKPTTTIVTGKIYPARAKKDKESKERTKRGDSLYNSSVNQPPIN